MPLFVFGTLRDPEMFQLIAGPGGRAEPAVLKGFTAERVAGEAVPMLVAKDGGEAEGLLHHDLTDAQMARLDAYELPWGYERQTMMINGAPADVYIADHTVDSSGEPWSIAQWDKSEGAASRLAALEISQHQPPLSPEALKRQWGMIRSRAFAHHRAGQETGPNTLRRSAGGTETSTLKAIHGDFFKFKAATLTHERFDGTQSQPLDREVFVGVDAALILPYDPVRDRVLLVEQFRVGPYFRRDGNPWALEPVAGIVDAGETPEQSARREAKEEAGLDITDIRPMFHAYPSPGNSTEHFYCYAGVVDLPDSLDRFGGLEDEAEDIRLHLLDREQALALIDAGEITILPLVSMLYWLDRNRVKLTSPA